MKIKLSPMLTMALAEICAQQIHARVVEMHLWTCDHVFHTPEAPWATKQPSERFNEVCAAVRSLKAGSWERREFVGAIKYYFEQIRKERHTHAKWQDHLAHVKEVNKGYLPTPFVYKPKEVVA